jgi:hypothetical protein
VHGRLACDLRDRRPCLEHGARVGVEVEVTLQRVRVAPGDHEHLLALVEQVLDEAAPGGEIEDVELVDRRWHDEQRDLAHARATRLVVDELEDIGAEDHCSGADREVLANRERRGVDARGKARRAGEVAKQLTHPTGQTCAAVIDDVLEHGGVGPREVRRRERVEDVGRGEPGLALGPPVGVGVGDQPVDRDAGGEIRLQQPPQQPVGLPCLVGEASVALARAQLGAPARHPGELAAEPDKPPRRAIGVARQPGHHAARRAGADQASPSGPDGGIGEHCVERARHAAHVTAPTIAAGARISRLRILPVGPLGSSSTNHTWRGYL